MEKESTLNYQTHSINSGYRCHDHDIYKNKKTTNHCGKAIDILYNYNDERTRDTKRIEEIRREIFNMDLQQNLGQLIE
jgi:hypothetical protein